MDLFKEQISRTEGKFIFPPLPNSPRDFDLLLDRAGIPKVNDLGHKVTTHSFRHTYGTLMAEAVDNNPFLLKEAMGHRKVTTTERYIHPTAPILEFSMLLSGIA